MVDLIENSRSPEPQIAPPSLLAEADLEADSDDDYVGGVSLSAAEHSLGFRKAVSAPAYSPPHGVLCEGSEILEAGSSTASTGDAGGSDEEDLDTDMEMHLYSCGEPSRANLPGSSGGVATQPYTSEVRSPLLADQMEFIPPASLNNAHVHISDTSPTDTIISVAHVTRSGHEDDSHTVPISPFAGFSLDATDETEVQLEESRTSVNTSRSEQVSNFVLQDIDSAPILRRLHPDFLPHEWYDDFETNMSACEFFEYWRDRYAYQDQLFPPIGEQVLLLDNNHAEASVEVTVEDLDEERCDLQGINWHEIQANREDARALRNMLYRNYRNNPEEDEPRYSDMEEDIQSPGRHLPCCDDFFRFHRFIPQHKAKLAHFQLRNLMAAPSRNAVLYSTGYGVSCVDTTLGTHRRVMDFSKSSNSRHDGTLVRISTLAAGHNVLAVGGYEGEYAIKSLFSTNDGTYTSGVLTTGHNAITNHVHTFPGRRSGLPQAVFCSNDSKLRVLDCHTNRIVGEHEFAWPVNCSATSPDGRLRLAVGDDSHPHIVDAESGRGIVSLERHSDHGFACDWSPNGTHMATGNQDGCVQIWDARRWDMPLSNGKIGTEIGGVRSLHFSPIGGGRPVLVMAEPADIVSVVDAVTFETQQRFDFFGEIGGTGFVPDGSSIFVANLDRTMGGLFEFERTDWQGSSVLKRNSGPRSDNAHKLDAMRYHSRPSASDTVSEDESWATPERNDWIPDDDLEDDPRVMDVTARRRHRSMALERLVF